MATAAIGTKRTFSAMNADSVGGDGWAPDLNATTFENRTGQRVGVDGSFDQTWAEQEPFPIYRKLEQAQYTSADFSADSLNSTTQSTPRTTPIPAPSPSECRREFEPDSSIVLIGIRGTGKSTLAVMASVACRRRVVDVENVFTEATGFSASKYRKQFGASNYNLRQEELLRTTLHTHDKGAIIVCNGSSLERSGQILLQEYSKTHPVIHILRDVPGIHRHLQILDKAKLEELLNISGPMFRRCSNYEFFNISETKAALSIVPANQPRVPPFLTLKRAERTFLKFLSLITAQDDIQGQSERSCTPLDIGYPLSEVATEQRKYTVAVQAPLSAVTSEESDIEALQFGADAFEVVVENKDPFAEGETMAQLTPKRAEQISRSISRVRRNIVVPLIYHVMPPSTQNLRLSYLEHVRYGLRMALEYSTIDLSLDEEAILEIVRTKGSTKIIGHLHAAVDWYNPFWVERYETAKRLGCNAVRFTRPANFMEDNAAIQSFRNKINELPVTIPLICFNTGRAGRRSACFNQVLTSVIPEMLRDSSDFEARVESNPETAWITAQEATHALYASFTYDPMKFYIVGASAGYSLSPAMHNAAYKACGMPHKYRTLQTPSLNSLQEVVRDPHFGGTAISLPFKIEVISITHSLSRHARAIGAVNTLIPVRHLNEDGSIPEDLELFQERNQAGPVKALYGDNTDWIGIRSCIRRGLSPANAVRPTSCGLVIGAGGMARAAVYAMLQLGVKNIVIFNRTHANAEKLVAHFTRLISSSPNSTLLSSAVSPGPKPTFHILRSRDDPWPAQLRPATIILSCIPTHPIDDSPAPNFTLPTQWMQSATGGVVLELAYRTLNTPLMRQVREEAHRAWICLDGLDLLPEQGFAQFEMFTGKRAPRRIMREEVLRSWRDEQGQSDPGMVQSRLEAIDDQEP